MGILSVCVHFAGRFMKRVVQRCKGLVRALPPQVMLGKIVKKTDKTEAAKGKK